MKLREWVVISVVMGFMLCAALVAEFSEVGAKTSLIREKREEKTVLTVTLSGAVEKPGNYECRPGSTLKQLLAKSGLTKQADRKKIPFKRVIYSSQTIEIPQKKRPVSRGMKISLEEK